MLRKLWALLRVEFLEEFSSPISLIFFLVLPLLFTAAVTAGLGDMGEEPDEAPQEVVIHLPIVLEDDGALTDALLMALATVNVEPEEVDELPEESFGLVVPADFSERLLAQEPATLTLQLRGDSSASPVVEQAVQAAHSRLSGGVLIAQAGLDQARELAPFDTQAEETRFFQSLLEDALDAAEHPPAVPQVVWPEEAQVNDPATNMVTSAEQASAGQIVTWVQITLLGAAEVLVNDRLRGTLRRMLVMPASRGVILGGKLVARLVLGLLQMAILLVGGALLFGVEWGQDPLAVALVSLAFALATVSLGILLATFVRTRGQASSMVVGLAMGLAALGGAWFPLEITPQLYRQAVQVLPSTWAMRAYTQLLARGADLQGVLPEIGILLGFAVLFFSIGVARFRRYA
jgi:ABC-2 type transport system permease protein